MIHFTSLFPLIFKFKLWRETLTILKSIEKKDVPIHFNILCPIHYCIGYFFVSFSQRSATCYSVLPVLIQRLRQLHLVVNGRNVFSLIMPRTLFQLYLRLTLRFLPVININLIKERINSSIKAGRSLPQMHCYHPNRLMSCPVHYHLHITSLSNWLLFWRTFPENRRSCGESTDKVLT